MSSGKLGLLPFLDGLIARDLGIKPEQVTTWFIHEMRKLMEADPVYYEIAERLEQEDQEERHQELSSHQFELWRQKCRGWAQQVLQRGPTSCA